MARHRMILMVATIGALILAGCGGGTGGSATGNRQSCRSSGSSGVCEGSYGTVKGNYAFRVEELDVDSGTPAWVSAEVAVESGALRVELVAPDGTVTGADIQAGQNVTVEGLAAVSAFGDLPVAFKVAEGETAGGISYTIRWELCR